MCRALANSHTLSISLYYNSSKQVHVYEAVLNSSDTELSFERKAVFENVDAMEQIDYNGQVGSGDHIG